MYLRIKDYVTFRQQNIFLRFVLSRAYVKRRRFGPDDLATSSYALWGLTLSVSATSTTQSHIYSLAIPDLPRNSPLRLRLILPKYRQVTEVECKLQVKARGLKDWPSRRKAFEPIYYGANNYQESGLSGCRCVNGI